jgi:pimeloyl-ACP methyl ester carboxylesterase
MLRRVVLVHGAAHGAWCWERLVPLLEARGLEPETLDLPGLGADPTPPGDVTFEAYVETICRAVCSRPERVLLVAHSMGGWPASAAAGLAPEHVGRLVYVASFMPKAGETVVGLAQSLLEPGEASGFGCMRPSALAGAHEIDPACVGPVFYSACPEDVVAAAIRRLRPQADAPLTPPIHVSDERFGRVPRSYVVCRLDRALPVSAQERLCARDPEVRRRELESDHSPFYSMPVALVDLLAEEAALPSHTSRSPASTSSPSGG